MNDKIDILLVDDEPDLLELLAMTIDLIGLTTDRARSGSEALSYLQKNKVPLVISDVRMNDGDGIELLRNVMNFDDPPRVILITGFADISPRQAYDLGASGFIYKPFKVQDLLTLIRRTIQPIAKVIEVDQTKAGDVFPHTIKMQLSGNFPGAEHDHAQIRIGRGGFSILCSEFSISADPRISFAQSIDGDANFSLVGHGKIVWLERAGAGQLKLGIEYNYLTPESIACLQLRSSTLPSYIPAFT